MRLNEHTALLTPTVLLVPYSRHHVPTYHAWMQDPALQAATASEPLTMDEEYAMQQSWRRDGDKLTFIICTPPLPPSTFPATTTIRGAVDDDPARMVGDINLFLSAPDSSDSDSAAGAVVAEIELMIAHPADRRRGFGRAALGVFLAYVLRRWDAVAGEYGSGSQERPELAYFRVRIGAENVGSLALFEGLGFTRTAEGVNYFGEVELRWRPDGEALQEGVMGMEAREVEYEDPVEMAEEEGG